MRRTIRQFSVAVMVLVLVSLSVASSAFAQADATLSTLAFGSCLRETQPAPILDTINSLRPDVFVFLGDNAYIDAKTPEAIAAGYARLEALDQLADLKRISRVLAIWDDHDYGINDCGNEYPLKQLSQRAFLDFWNEPKDSPRRTQEGIYTSYFFGEAGKRVHVVMLDTRYFRDLPERDPEQARRRYIPTTDPTKTVLGQAQWTWLEAELAEPCDVRMIASSIQVLPREHQFERWGKFPHERDRLLALIAKSDTPTVLLSGDRHHAEISKLDQPNNTPLFEITSSSLNTSRGNNTTEPNAHRVGQVLTVNNFGLIRFDWDKRTLSLQLVDEAKAVRLEQTLNLKP